METLLLLVLLQLLPTSKEKLILVV